MLIRPALALLLCAVCICLKCGAQASLDTVQIEFRYAKNLSVEQDRDYTLFTIRNINRNSKDTYRYALVPKDKSVPKLDKDITIIRTPVQRIAIMATTFVGYLDALDVIDRVVGASSPEFINNEAVRERLETGEIQAIQTGQSLNIENMLLLQPDVILASSSGNPRFDIHPQLARTGLPIAVTATYMEAHPLARLEWIKFIGSLTGQEEVATRYFDATAERYEALSEMTQALEARPTVFTNAPYSGSWHIAGGKSYTAQAIKDAGANYLWADNNSAGGVPLDFERVFSKAAHADFWINMSSHCSLDDLYGADSRFRKFKAAQTGQLYNNCKQLNQNGGNNIWERGIVHPDEVLGDLIQIFHSNLLPGREFIYYVHLN